MLDKPVTWKKHGLIFRPDATVWWMRTHGMIPTPEPMGGGLVKLYFSGRNDANQSHIGWIIVDLDREARVVEVASEPVLRPGELGCFDDNGVTPSCLVNVAGEKRLYYIGWNPGSTVRMHLFGGLAISRDGGATFERYSRAPIIERCRTDPFLNTAPFVIHDGKRWLMYFVGGVGWVHRDLPRYNIRLATSDDGLEWRREGHVCIDFKPGENALARPFVIHYGGLYRMWFAYKGAAYRMGYAESRDGISWVRKDELAGMGPSASGFDSEMVEYGAVVPHEGRLFMLYNGDNYGGEGIGLAIAG